MPLTLNAWPLPCHVCPSLESWRPLCIVWSKDCGSQPQHRRSRHTTVHGILGSHSRASRCSSSTISAAGCILILAPREKQEAAQCQPGPDRTTATESFWAACRGCTLKNSKKGPVSSFSQASAKLSQACLQRSSEGSRLARAAICALM